MMIINRYLVLEIAKTLLAIVVILLIIFISFRLANYLGDAASGKIPSHLIVTLLLLKLLINIMLILPLALFLATLLALGRLYRDSEMTALVACGVSPFHLHRAILLLAVPYMGMVGILSLYLAPLATQVLVTAQNQARQSANFGGLYAGRFNEAQSGEIVFYIEKISADGKTMHNIFIQNRQQQTLGIITAKQGYQEFDPKTGNQYLVLHQGYRYEGQPGQANYRMIEFKQYRVLIHTAETQTNKYKTETMSLQALWDSSQAEHQAELHWRFSIPASTLILALLAVPLSHTTPRQGRHLKLIVGLLIYVVYFNSMGIARAWIEKGHLASGWSLWWLHFVVLSGVGLLTLRQLGLGWVRLKLGRG